jgi:small subunit ribosomal protein S9
MPATHKKTEEKELTPVMPVAAVTPDDDDDIEVVIRDEVDEKGKEKYYQSVGRRKESIARVRLFTKKSTDSNKDDHALLTVNGKDYVDYFNDVNLLARVEAPLRKLKSLNRFKATAMVNGGGMAGQAEAVKHGLARALEVFDINFRKKLKKAGFLTRDPRVKERRKYGLKKARKAPSWSKR